ncbi:unnamed protein product [Aphanomyces euteiches]
MSSISSHGNAQKYPMNKAGAAYGTGYCDAQCPHDIKFINGGAIVKNWTVSGGQFEGRGRGVEGRRRLDHPVNKNASLPGVGRGSCPITSGVPSEVESKYPNATVTYSNIRVGDLWTTTSVGISPPTTKLSPPRPRRPCANNQANNHDKTNYLTTTKPRTIPPTTSKATSHPPTTAKPPPTSSPTTTKPITRPSTTA